MEIQVITNLIHCVNVTKEVFPIKTIDYQLSLRTNETSYKNTMITSLISTATHHPEIEK